MPRGSHIIRVRVAELRQLFNAIDPSPFRERDLDPRAEEFIVDWSKDFPRDASLALLVHLERAAGQADEALILRDAIHEYFHQRASGSRRKLRELFSRGRTSLAIALAFLTMSTALGDGLASYFGDSHLAGVLREGLLIGGWVAMWRPLQVFLYDWWPIRADVRLYDRLSAMPVRIEYAQAASTDAWRFDWPAAEQLAGRRAPLRAASNAALSQEKHMASHEHETRHRHTPDEERKIREAALDQTLEGSFPASDPPSSNPNPDDHDAIERTPRDTNGAGSTTESGTPGRQG